MSSLDDRLPLPAPELMTEAQRAAANDLIAGPRKGVKGPFIPLLRSPELMSRLQKVGEYLRFQSLLAPKLSEFATLCVARSWSQQFEWVMHVPLALKAGICEDTIDAIRDGRRPSSMSPAEAAVHDFVAELQNTKGVAQATYDSVIAEVGDQGLIDLVGIVDDTSCRAQTSLRISPFSDLVGPIYCQGEGPSLILGLRVESKLRSRCPDSSLLGTIQWCCGGHGHGGWRRDIRCRGLARLKGLLLAASRACERVGPTPSGPTAQPHLRARATWAAKTSMCGTFPEPRSRPSFVPLGSSLIASPFLAASE